MAPGDVLDRISTSAPAWLETSGGKVVRAPDRSRTRRAGPARAVRSGPRPTAERRPRFARGGRSSISQVHEYALFTMPSMNASRPSCPISGIGGRARGAQPSASRDRVELVVAVHTRAPAVRSRRRSSSANRSTDLRPRAPVARERRQEHATRLDDTHDLARARPAMPGSGAGPTGGTRRRTPRRGTACRVASPCTSGNGDRPPAFSTSSFIIGRARSRPTIGMPASCSGSPS